MWKHLIVVILLIGELYCTSIDLGAIWQDFKTFHGKSYTASEEEHRRLIFEDNVRFIMEHNLKAYSQDDSFTLGINKFCDLSLKEFDERFNTLTVGDAVPLDSKERVDSLDIQNLPSSIDYRDKGMVTPVEDQGDCGSCYSFGTLAALEGAWMKSTGKLVTLSKQNIVDCCTETFGCKGGTLVGVYKFLMTNGVNNATQYPYVAKEQTCHFSNEAEKVSVKSYKEVTPNSEESLQEAVANAGPVAIAIFSSIKTYQHYKSGVYNDPECNQAPNHAVVCIGYGVEDSKKFWLLKDSAGVEWGEKGFMKIARDAGNMCSLTNGPVYPIV